MSTEDLSEIEQELMDAVPDALRDGVELLEWWQKADPSMDYREHYQETKTLNRPGDRSYGFFDTVELSSGTVPINGNVQEMFYDEPKAPPDYEGAADQWMHQQIREFILKYFMRISDFRQPELAESGNGEKSSEPEVTGFGFSQVYYKLRETGEIGKFPEEGQEKIVELTEFQDKYEWIVLKNPIFGFGFEFRPFGALFDSLIGVSGPEVKLPAKVFNYLVISNDFVVNEEHEADPEDPNAVRGRYGFGYAFVNDPEPSVYGYGPGQLQPAFEQMIWEVRNSGEVRVRAAFVAQEPKGILQLSVDPLAWGFQFTKALGGEVPDFLRPIKRAWDKLPLTNLTFDPVLPTVRLLNLLTVGQAEKLGISKDQIIKEALFIHFQQHYQTIVGSLQTWRQIKDWTDAAALARDSPWVVSGKSS